MSIRKKIVSYMLCLAMTISFMPHSIYATNNEKIKTGMAVSKSNTQSTTSDIIGIDVPTKFSSPGYEVVFKVNNQWDGAFNGEFILKNTSNEPIENWSVAFNFNHEITNIWNAKIVSCENGKYILKNVGYNQDILPGNSVSIGFQANYEDLIVAPTSYNLLATSQEAVTSDYKIDFRVTSDWGQAFNGEISITNTSEKVIEDWTLEFDFDRKITSFWTADIEKHEGNHYVIKNKGYNANIKAGETLVLGFAAAPGNVDNEPENYVLCQKNVKEEIDYEKDTDNDRLPDYLEKELGSDPNNTDSDADGLLDGYEYFNLGTDPTIADSDNNGISDADEDFDDDKLTNIEEYKLGTEPYCKDTDGDYLSDYEEVNTYKTDPLVADTDGDGICDGDEIKIGLDPLNKCTYGVPDSEYKVEQTIESDAINYNKTEDKYQVSLDVTASGCVENHLYIAQSPFYQMMSDNPAILGRTIEVNYDEGTVDKATIKFKVDDKYIEGASDAYIDDSELVGLKRFNVFEYFKEDNLLLPIETTFNLDDNTVKADVPSLGTYCIIDLVMLMDSWKQIDNASSNEIEDEIPNNFNRASMSGIIDNNINFNRADNSSILDFSNNMLFAPKTASEQKASVKIPSYIVAYGEYNGNQYALMEPYKSLTWEEARIKCELLGGHLATITDEKEQAFIVSRLLTKSNKYAYWIGGQYNQGKATWFTGEKSNYRANELSGSVTQKYLEMWSHKNNVGPVIGTWQCRSNQIKNYGYICEWEKQGKVFQYVSSYGLETNTLEGDLERFGTTNSDRDSLTDSQEVNWPLMQKDGKLPTLKMLMDTHAGYVVAGLDRLTEEERNNAENTRVLPLLSDPRHEDSDRDGIWDDEDTARLEFNALYIRNSAGKVLFFDDRDIFFLCNSMQFRYVLNDEQKYNVFLHLKEHGTITEDDLVEMGYDDLPYGTGTMIDLVYSSSRLHLTDTDVMCMWNQMKLNEIANCIEFMGNEAAFAQIQEIYNSGKPGGHTISPKAKGSGDSGKIHSTSALEDHIKNRQFVNKNGKRYKNRDGIVGAHNSNNFYANDVKVHNTNKIYDVYGNEVKGLTQVEYSMPELDKAGNPTGNYNSQTFPKTIYDPSIISDEEYITRGIEAANNALANEPTKVMPRMWSGVDSQGVKWIGCFENGDITSMWPTN